MMINTKHLMKKISARAKPDASVRLRVREAFTAKNILPATQHRRVSRAWKIAMGSSSIVLSLAGATAAFAYTSDSVLPNHPLYIVRTAIESAQLQLASPQSKEQVRFDQLRRHLHETEVMAQRQMPLPKSHTDKIAREIDHFKEQELPAAAVASSSQAADHSTVLEIEKEELVDLQDQETIADSKDDEARLSQNVAEQADEIDQHIQKIKERKTPLLDDEDMR